MKAVKVCVYLLQNKKGPRPVKNVTVKATKDIFSTEKKTELVHSDELKMDEEDLDGIDENDELYAVAPKRVRRLIGFDWASGYVSPFRPTDDACAHAIMLRAGAFRRR